MDNGFNYAEKSDMCTEASYSHSYTAMKRDCKAWSCTVRIAKGSVTGHRDVFTNSEQRAGFDVDSGRAAFHRRGRDEKKKTLL